MKPLHVEPAYLREAGSVADGAAGDIDDAAARVDAQTAGPWGADPLGTAIGESFTPAFELAFDCVDANLEILRGYAEKLRLMADSYDRTEDENGQGMTAVRQRLDSVSGR